MLELSARLLLLRHGHIEDRGLMEGHSLTPLSRRGRIEVTAAALHLCARGGLAAIYTSPLVRARQTAEVISACTGVSLSSRLCDFLAEIDCGCFNARPIDEVRVEHPDLWAANQRQDDDRFRWPGGESYRELRARVLRGLRALAREHRGELVLAVTHTSVIGQAIGWLHGTGAACWEKFRPHSASLTELSVRTGQWRVERYDDISHLELVRSNP